MWQYPGDMWNWPCHHVNLIHQHHYYCYYRHHNYHHYRYNHYLNSGLFLMLILLSLFLEYSNHWVSFCLIPLMVMASSPTGGAFLLSPITSHHNSEGWAFVPVVGKLPCWTSARPSHFCWTLQSGPRPLKLLRVPDQWLEPTFGPQTSFWPVCHRVHARKHMKWHLSRASKSHPWIVGENWNIPREVLQSTQTIHRDRERDWDQIHCSGGVGSQCHLLCKGGKYYRRCWGVTMYM